MQLRGTDAIHEVNCIEVLIWCSELSGDGSAVCAKRNRGVREARDTAMASGYARIVIKARVAEPAMASGYARIVFKARVAEPRSGVG